MAIKGKKKSQSRGSQARRRPATAPRAALVSKKVVPWYKTNAFRAAAIVVLVILAGILTAVVSAKRAESQRDERRRDALQSYAGDLRSLQQSLAPVGTELQGAPLKGSEVTVDDLVENAQRWSEEFQAAESQAIALTPPTGLETSQTLIIESISLFRQAGDLFALAPEADGKLRTDLLRQAGGVRDRASSVWRHAVTLLDAELIEAGGNPSGVIGPTEGAAPPQPQTTPEPEATAGGQGSGKAGGKKKGSKDSGNKND